MSNGGGNALGLIVVLAAVSACVNIFGGGRETSTARPSTTASYDYGSAPSQRFAPSVAASANTPETARAYAYIAEASVNLREGASSKTKVIQRLPRGAKLEVLNTVGSWTLVRDTASQGVGFVASRLLSSSPPQAAPAQPSKKPRGTADATIVARIIANSRASYSGSCACPDDYDRAGRRCGRRSAYSRAGGAHVICYPSDVTPAMIAAHK